ncbi:MULTISPECIES: FadR/GntR family transcriptional regulator [Actibacterium]|nr:MULTISPECIES: FCD domain-containing protein [Actibacterium]ALG89430.1 GntR family transcriptional regulator [Actibacterium sp. EMB200-NS6]
MVAEAIKAWVMEQGLKSGDRLPGEAELIERFGMSKGTIREATRILEAQGLVRTRSGPGGGTFVHEMSSDRARALLSSYFYFRDLSLADIYQVRRALEPEVAASLAGKLSDSQLQQLEDIMAGYNAPARTAEEEREQHIASLSFHATLAEMSDNPLLSFIIAFVTRTLSDLTVYRKLYDPPNHALWAEGKTYQGDLLRALRAGDSDAARTTMVAHMQTAQALMEAQEAEVVLRLTV